MSPSRILLVLLCGTALALGLPERAVGQDVEMLGARYGTRPPDAYFRERARNPDAYRFSRGRATRIRPAGAAGSGGDGSGGGSGGPLRSLGPRDGVVEGDFAIPVLLGLFSDTEGEGPYTVDEIDTDYFADVPGTVRAYYEEVSGGRVRLEGVIQPWEQVGLSRGEVTRGDGALTRATLGEGEGGIGNFIYRTVQRVIESDPDFDWGRFDNDGPDGIPNSGDDDGYVDALAVMHPTPGAECDGDLSRIWSHKWRLDQALVDEQGRGVTIETSTVRPGGGRIRIRDYFVQPAVSCDGSSLNEIGIFTHEVGHVFGLPDLYDVRRSSAHAGVGTWDLMASGAWGCDDDSPASPCHMGAWSKAMLGWVDVVELEGGVDHGARTLGPVQEGGEVYRVPAQDGSGEYFLLEHRAPIRFDSLLHGGGGLLVWQVDPVRVANRWGANTVNGSDTPGVRLRQADGRDDLGTVGGNRGDAGDPFPGVTDNTVFHAGSNPAATSYEDTPTGLTVLDIEPPTGSTVGFSLLTRFSAVTLVADGSDGTTDLFTVDGAAPRASGETFTAAPFSTRTVEAAAGELLEPGLRRPFERWLDGTTDRSRPVEIPLDDMTLTAMYDDDAREVRLEVDLDGGAGGIVPAVVESFPTSSDLWFQENQEVSVEVKPRAGFSFTEWTGALEGEDNPAFVTMNEPVVAGAALETIYEVPAMSFTPVAARDESIDLLAMNATEPVRWSLVEGELPEGLSVRSGGVVSGAALETGTFTVTVRARDAIGLTAEGEVTLEVRPAEIPPARAAAHFLGTGESLSEAEARFLDRRGNGNGRYDLGDFRSWVTDEGEAAGAAAQAPGIAPEPEEERRR